MSETIAQPMTDEAEVIDEEATTPVVRSRRNEHGMVSAEWAVGLIAAIAIAGVLLAVVTTGSVKTALLKFILMVIAAFADKL
ncbi:MAG: DUF4244 domain-containing protein [Propionibacteriaceae bacterium]